MLAQITATVGAKCFLLRTGASCSRQVEARPNRKWLVLRWRNFAKSIGRRFTASYAVADILCTTLRISRRVFSPTCSNIKFMPRVDQRKGRFRSFLLASLKNFLADVADKERTLKRGGAQI